MLSRMANVTQILAAIKAGDPEAAAELLPLVYDELRKLASTRMAAERPDHTLNATALVHEAYLRLVGSRNAGEGFGSRGHFFGAAAEAMRRILVESARRKDRLRHGGGRQRLDLNQLAVFDAERNDELLELDEALGQLEAEEPETAAVVKLRYFAGLTTEQAADALGISLRTANRHWAYARAWLFQALGGDSEEKSN
jgi:RNA polymerase sigma factor (TIGR02999 family)